MSNASEGALSHAPSSVEVTVGHGAEAPQVDDRCIEEIVTVMRDGPACIDLHPSLVTDSSYISPNQASLHLAVSC